MKWTNALLSYFVLFNIVIISSSMAEPFTMANGNQFGNSPATVKQKKIIGSNDHLIGDNESFIYFFRRELVQ